MTTLQKLSWCVIVGLVAACLGAGVLAPAPYAKQFRDAPNSPPCQRFPLGTDALGRDRLSRLLYGGRISLLLAPAAATLSVLLAGLIGTFAGYLGGIYERIVLAAIDLFMSLPWLFLLITVRALLPLDIAPAVSIAVTFGLLGVLGWAASARIICSGVRALRSTDFIVAARANGSTRWRTMTIQILPNLTPVLWAQFLISVPVFILAEANLTILGLGVAEPLPSWGSSLKELSASINFSAEPWRLVPLAILIGVVWAFQIVVSREESFA